MLPKFSQQSYLNFQVVLTKLQEEIIDNDFNLAKIREIFQELEAIFQKEILGASVEGLDPSLASVWQSTQTEIHRTLRLLGTDLLFLQSSRQQRTTEQRLKIIRHRLDQLIGYCQVILQ